MSPSILQFLHSCFNIFKLRTNHVAPEMLPVPDCDLSHASPPSLSTPFSVDYQQRLIRAEWVGVGAFHSPKFMGAAVPRIVCFHIIFRLSTAQKLWIILHVPNTASYHSQHKCLQRRSFRSEWTMNYLVTGFPKNCWRNWLVVRLSAKKVKIKKWKR